jgi:hypothetical protein
MKQIIAAAVVTMTQMYMLEPWKYPVFARLWDWIATVCGRLANILGWWSMKARSNYYTAITACEG